MTTLIDSNLTLVYKNMVGLSNIVTNTSGDSYFISSVSVNSNLFVSGYTIFNGPTTINSNLNISGVTLVNGPTTVASSLNVSGSTTINGPTTFASSLYILGTTNVNNNLLVNGSTIINGPVTYNSQLNVSGTATFQNGIYVNNIYGNILNINAPIINIGDANSIVYINGTATYIASTETLIVDKMISLNVNSSTLQGADIGVYSGIEIMGISSFGFIRTSIDASRYEIQSPLLGAPTNYITIQDLNNNLVISGTTILLGNTTINSLLNISGLGIFNSASTINNSLNISGSSIISGSCTINNSLIISGTTIFNNACSINSSLSINGLVNINNAASINSSLNVFGSTIINGQMTINSSLFVSGTTNINNATSINSSLNISGVTVINGPISMNSYLNVSGNTFVGGDQTINSNLFVSGFSILNNSISINSTLQVSGFSIFNNSVSFNSQLGVVGQIVAPLPDYQYNTDAKNGGIPIWGFYRTGGIIKVRLDDTPSPPVITLNGANTINLIIGNMYFDLGGIATDYTLNSLPIYLTFTGQTTPILISGNSTYIGQIGNLSVGTYTLTYTVTDSGGLISTTTRTLNIYNP